MRWCPHRKGYGSSLKEDAGRCTHCAGTGLVVDEAAVLSGVEPDPYADFVQELELADRYAEQASLASGHAPRALARYRHGRGPSPYEQPHRPTPAAAPQPGERVVHEDRDGQRQAGRVVERLDQDGTAVVAFDRGGQSVVELERLEREAA
jgi:hypothetical protein